MSDTTPFRHERLLELLADRALEGDLDPGSARELEQLLVEYPGERASIEGFEIAAAAAALACLPAPQVQDIPPALAERVVASALTPRVVGVTEPHARPSPRPRRDFVRWSGWIAAAACLLLVVFVALVRRTTTTTSATRDDVVAQRATFLAEAAANKKRIVQASWKATSDPAAQGASGDVVFDPDTQRGFMRFHGLAANDRTREQYQLWIFDAQQDERFPIDGGVFDVAGGAATDPKTGDVVVPIVAKIRVVEPKLFAVTVEKPGGVVVSKRERIVVTAAPI